MDARLVGWARAVKARRGGTVPPLWLFSDPVRTPELARAIAALPAGLCGVVFRHDGVAGRGAMLRAIARLCRARRVALVVAGAAPDIPAGVGRHLRGGHGSRPRGRFCTSSAHALADVVRGRRAGADAVFVSPVFPTDSHRGAPALGPVRWAMMAKAARIPVLALGGVSGRSVGRLPRWASGAGAIGALLPTPPP